MVPFSKNFNFNFDKEHQKNSYERRDYESVDEKSLSYAMSRKTMKKEFRLKRVKLQFVWPFHDRMKHFTNLIDNRLFIKIILCYQNYPPQPSTETKHKLYSTATLLLGKWFTNDLASEMFRYKPTHKFQQTDRQEEENK